MKKFLLLLIVCYCTSCTLKRQEVTLPDKIWGGEVMLTIDTNKYVPNKNLNQKLAVLTAKDKSVTVLTSPSFATIKFEDFLDIPEKENDSVYISEGFKWNVMPCEKIYKAVETRDNNYILHYTIYLTDVRTYYMQVIMDQGKEKQLEPYFDEVATTFRVKT